MVAAADQNAPPPPPDERPGEAADHTADTARSMRLSREDWIDAAWKALANGTIETVKVDRLAQQLRVTRGSFYWHFKDKKALIEAVLDRWLGQLGLQQAIAPRMAEYATPQDRLWAIYEYVVRNITGPQSLYLRIWSRRSRQVHERLLNEDLQRLEHYTSLFREAGFGEPEASRRADLYFGMVMSEFLRHGNLPLAKRLELARDQHEILIAPSKGIKHKD